MAGVTGAVVALVPVGLDDPARPSGGNTYDRKVLGALTRTGWQVREQPVPGRWPEPDGEDLAGLGRVLADLPDGAVVLVDGLIASAAAPVLVGAAGRVRLVVLVHMPLGTDQERLVLAGSRRVITTSRWTRDWLVGRHGLAPEAIRVAVPGVDPAPPAGGSAGGTRLLTVGVIAPHKGQDLLVDALATLPDLDWSCTVVGALDVAPEFADRVRAAAAGSPRIRFRGPLTGPELAGEYTRADLLVLPSRAETYGIVIGDALARAIPVLAAQVGGVPEALGAVAGSARPGMLVPPDDPAALAGALRVWLGDADRRRELRRRAAARRRTLTGWSVTADQVSRTLLEAAR